MEAKFALPSSNTAWQAKESEWPRPTPILYNDDALKEVSAGRPPRQPVSDFGLVALVPAVLDRVCALEAITGPDLADLYASSGERMGRSVQALDDMVRRRMGEASWGVPPDPVLQSAKPLLNSAFYHLYASIPLAVMKKLLWCPAALGDPREIATLFSGAASPDLYKALIRAADQLRIDCRLGPKYLKTVAPLQYGPDGAIGPYEGGLLPFWYLEFVHSRLPQAASRQTLSTPIDEGLLEVEDLRLQMQDRPQSLPLAVTAELLSDSTVWKSKFLRRTLRHLGVIL
ncbi:hypothetical protein INS49_008959 [Diaporthe citri]|uniref:uncharacterized protein n=1 Tax=Diaporthe citri TaxID=83186 RepID=UPI001C7EC942|nr:uncharacterized protein INS49_008959 [Diaporthe citri]KAG6363856.1 hypothetical protein INS49_008959 [Diaporthe citri]